MFFSSYCLLTNFDISDEYGYNYKQKIALYTAIIQSPCFKLLGYRFTFKLGLRTFSLLFLFCIVCKLSSWHFDFVRLNFKLAF